MSKKQGKDTKVITFDNPITMEAHCFHCKGKKKSSMTKITRYFPRGNAIFSGKCGTCGGNVVRAATSEQIEKYFGKSGSAEEFANGMLSDDNHLDGLADENHAGGMTDDEKRMDSEIIGAAARRAHKSRGSRKSRSGSKPSTARKSRGSRKSRSGGKPRSTRKSRSGSKPHAARKSRSGSKKR